MPVRAAIVSALGLRSPSRYSSNRVVTTASRLRSRRRFRPSGGASLSPVAVVTPQTLTIDSTHDNTYVALHDGDDRGRPADRLAAAPHAGHALAVRRCAGHD